ncbi:MAG: T9SS type A sorting domain-containing protein [Prevotellaceae bacterium]|jgi:hypothetical protein|nr:T9SS type A sorting domain-containing protein [Prevotellaceae bacterium]
MKKIILILVILVCTVSAKAANQYQGTIRDNPVGNIWTNPRVIVVNVVDDNPANYVIMIDEDIVIDEIVVGDEQPDGSRPITRATYATIPIDAVNNIYCHLENGYIKGDSLVFTIGFAYGLPATNITTRAEFKLEKEGTTSLSQPTFDTFTLSTQPKQITVSGTTETVQVYNISGQIVAQGAGAGSYAVPAAGVYIVRVGSEARKVIVP